MQEETPLVLRPQLEYYKISILYEVRHTTDECNQTDFLCPILSCIQALLHLQPKNAWNAL